LTGNSGIQVTATTDATSVAFDETVPTPTITAPSTTRNSPYIATIDFGEKVTGFDATGVTVTNGTAANAQELEDGSYYVEITPTNEGTVNVDFNHAGIADLAGNACADAVAVDTIFDNGQIPTILSGYVKLDNTSMTVHFGEGVFNNSGGAVTTSDFTFTTNSAASFDTVTKLDGNPLVGGETAIRFNLTPGVTLDSHTLSFAPADDSSIFDGSGNAMLETETTGTQYFNDPIFANYLNISNNAWTEVGTEGNILAGGITHTADGSDCCQFENPTTDYAGRGIQTNKIPVIAGTPYTYNLYTYAANEVVLGDITDIKINVNVSYSDGSNTTLSLQNPSVQGSWTPAALVFTHTAPAGTTWVKIRIMGKNDPGNINDIYVDDLTMSP
ncbi:MAG: hypothetical protein KAI17_21790, partial [Thiotrichaceae bacterium]|nr:hypothetical protein [Thiotrichaceae bacterium]